MTLCERIADAVQPVIDDITQDCRSVAERANTARAECEARLRQVNTQLGAAEAEIERLALLNEALTAALLGLYAVADRMEGVSDKRWTEAIDRSAAALQSEVQP